MLKCPICGKKYTRKTYFDKHVVKCRAKNKKKKEVVKKMNEKVEEIKEKEKGKKYTVPKGSELVEKLWATMEGLSSQLRVVIDLMGEIKTEITVNNETRDKISKIITEGIKHAEEEEKEYLASTPEKINKKIDEIKGKKVDFKKASELLNKEREDPRPDASFVEVAFKASTEKAVMFETTDGVEFWTPKSQVINDFIEDKNITQELQIKNWILKSKGVIE